MDCLIDSGAQVSTLPSSLWDQLSLQFPKNLCNKTLLAAAKLPNSLTVANGQSIKAEALLLPQLTLYPKDEPHIKVPDPIFFRLEGSDSPIIGMDLILRHEMFEMVLRGLQRLYEENNSAAPLPLRSFNASINKVRASPIKPTTEEEDEIDFTKMIDTSFKQKTVMLEVLKKYKKIFSARILGRSLKSQDMPIRIISDAILPKQQRRYISPNNSKILDEYIDEVLEAGIIEPCVDPPTICNSVIVKQGEKHRVCFDYTLLNSYTVPCYYPLPNIEELKDALKGSKIFGKVDLTKGFHQMTLEPESRPYTAFYGTRNRSFQFRVAPFGLSNTPSYFQVALTNILGDSYFKHCILYIDDILIFAESEESFITACEEVLSKLLEGGVVLSPNKCSFGSLKIEFLGLQLDGKKFKLKKERFAEIQEFSIPKNTKELRGFLGCCSAFRDYLVDYPIYEAKFSKLAAPTVKSKAKITFSEEQLVAFEAMKNYIQSADYLYIPRPNQKFFLFSDASDFGYGALLAQEIEDPETPNLNIIEYSNLKPVGIVSKNFANAALQWSTFEKELYSIVAAFIKFDKFIGSAEIEVVTDHKNLIYLAARPNPKVIRWLIFLSSFKIKWKWRPGKINFVADFFSRCAPLKDKEKVTLQNFFKKGRGSVAAIAYNPQPQDPTPSQTLQECQELLSQQIPVSQCIALAHNDNVGHNGVKATIKILDNLKLSWPNRISHVKAFIRTCPICQLNQSYTKVQYNKSITSSYPYHTIASDVVEFTFDDQIHYIIIFVDSFSLFTHLHHTTKVDSTEIANAFLLHIYASHGLPLYLKTDNARYFNNEFLQEVSKVLGYQHIFSIANHSQSNGQAEARIKRVLQLLRKFLTIQECLNWNIHIPLVQRLLNFSYSTAIEDFPARIIFGIRPYNHPNNFLSPDAMPITDSHDMSEYIKTLSEGIDILVYQSYKVREKYFQQRFEKYESLQSKDSYSFAKGDLVLLPRNIDHRPSPKLMTSYKGPFEVIEVKPPIITLMNGLTARSFQCHIAECVPFFVDISDLRVKYPHLASTFIAEDEHIVEAIICHYGSLIPPIAPKVQFYIKWKAWDPSANSWEPYSNLKHLSKMKDYLSNSTPYSSSDHKDIPPPENFTTPKKRTRRK